MIKNCIVCGKEFEAKVPWAKCCSKVCSVKFWHPKTEEELKRFKENKATLVSYKNLSYICQYCGKEFIHKNHTANIFCSRECSFAWAKDKKDKKVYIRKLKMLLRKCIKQKERKARDNIENQKHYKVCKNCGKEFYTMNTRIKYCSDCRYKESITYTKECVYCGKDFETNRSQQKCCSSECSRKYNNKKREERKSIRLKGKIINTDITLLRLIKRDKGICKICGKPVDLNDYYYENETFIAGDNYPSIDHVFPLAQGGFHSWNNVQLAHRICNSVKSDNWLI